MRKGTLQILEDREEGLLRKAIKTPKNTKLWKKRVKLVESNENSEPYATGKSFVMRRYIG